MKKFIYKLLLMSAVFYALLYAVQYGYNQYLRTSDDVNHSLWNTIANGEANADIIFIGSSRALVHYDPRIFKERLDYNGYVLGLNSTGYDLQKVIRNLYFENNIAPKIIVQNVDVGSFNKTSTFLKPPYFPYYNYKTATVLSEVDDQAYYEWAIPMYKYRTYIQNHKRLFKRTMNPYYQGYMEMEMTWEEYLKKAPKGIKKSTVDYGSFDYDKGFELIQKVIDEASEMGSELYLIWAPEYIDRLAIEEPYLSRLVVRFDAFDRKYEHVYFLDFTKDSINHDTKNFYNGFHLNKVGVQIFSNMVVDSIETNNANKKLKVTE